MNTASPRGKYSYTVFTTIAHGPFAVKILHTAPHALTTVHTYYIHTYTNTQMRLAKKNGIVL